MTTTKNLLASCKRRLQYISSTAVGGVKDVLGTSSQTTTNMYLVYRIRTQLGYGENCGCVQAPPSRVCDVVQNSSASTGI